MKRAASSFATLLVAAALTQGVWANGQGTPIEPAPAPQTLEPSGSAPAAVQSSSQSGQNWWLIALSAAVAIGIIVAISDDGEDATTGTQ
jgi:hypothetical protein